jgi:RNA polymerase sigma factor (sigma-70 family)
MPLDDADVSRLTRAMKRGDEAAWRWFHDTYYEDLRRLALGRGASESDVADVIQRSYLRILKHMKPFDKESDLRAWCFCLLRSEVIDTSRKMNRHQSMTERFKEWLSHKSADWAQTDLLDGLPPADRSLLEKHYVEGWSQADLAADAGVTVKAIESRIARLRRRARVFIESRDPRKP